LLNNQPRFVINWIVSGIPSINITRSANARFVISKFVNDRLIFLFKRTAKITNEFPTIPTTPIIKNKNVNTMITAIFGVVSIFEVAMVTFSHFVVSFVNGECVEYISISYCNKAVSIK